MAQLPDNIVSIMMVDNAGAVVSVPVGDLFAQVTAAPTATKSSTTATAKVSSATSQIISNNISAESSQSISIVASESYIPAIGKDLNSLINSPLYVSGANVNMNEGDFNVVSKNGLNGYKIDGHNFAFAYGNIIYIGDDNNPSIAVQQIYLTALIEDPAETYNKLLQVEPDGKVTAYVAPAENSIIFSNGDELVGEPTKLSWNNTTNLLSVLGSAKISANLAVESIGEYTTGGGVDANNSWTFSSNITVPAVPTNATHAASKEYVDNTALTGLKLGAAVKTVAVSNIALTGLSAVNGYTPSAGDRILVIGQTTASQNGVYIADASTWSRATDSDSDAELRGYQYLISAGTNANYRYGNTNQSTITVGSTSITYQAISAGESDPIFTASAAFGITSGNIANWNTAYARSLIGASFSGTTLTIAKQDGSTISTSISLSTSNVSEGSNLYFTDARARASVSAGTGISYNSSTGVISVSGTTYTDSSIRGLFSAGTGLSYNSSTGAFSSTITQYTDALARASISAGSGISYNSSTGVISSTYSTPSLAAVCAVSADATGYSIIASSFYESSDVRFKNIIGENPDIDVSGIDVIKYMRTTYDKDKIRYGYSAQQVYDICPELVHNDGISLSVNYTDLHSLKILQLERRVAELEAKLGI